MQESSACFSLPYLLLLGLAEQIMQFANICRLELNCLVLLTCLFASVLTLGVVTLENFSKMLQVKNWVRELRKMLGTGIDLAIAGNKTDLEEQRRVDSAVAEE